MPADDRAWISQVIRTARESFEQVFDIRTVRLLLLGALSFVVAWIASTKQLSVGARIAGTTISGFITAGFAAVGFVLVGLTIGSGLMTLRKPSTNAPSFLIIGDAGTLACDVPLFEGVGPLRFRDNRQGDWTVLRQTEPTGWQRGIGAVHMMRDTKACEPLLDKRLALHVLDILQAASASISTGERAPVTTTYEYPAHFYRVDA